MKKYAALIVIGVCLTGTVFSLLVQRKVVGMQCFRTVTMDWKKFFLILLKP